MKFYQRFAYYLIGLVLGCFFVAAMWSGKDVRCNYFPNARVLNDLRTKPFHHTKEADSLLSQGWISEADIKNILTYGDVDFDRSNIKEGGGKKYLIEGQTAAKQKVEIEVVNFEDKAVLKTIRKTKSE
ncbi:DUF4258 domain-containing protein [Flavobacterium silvaticum]|uniref:DUF4258 domain-containing protein n=1 Tax=Flavobacterium silvaticum TaxID=1852020 RepID=A0A972JIB4_9FLAO|nr:DUF4258 domain-containing protein [Flavobacterium silvaticum]NMH28830.1 DUF4258 domain-containing protein [Flavobacterium silvaticum]